MVGFVWYLKNIKMSNFQIFKKKFFKTSFDYYLVNSTDDFLNEYVPAASMKLKWLTGFTGSNGLALIGKEKNFFFTDGRYSLQAKNEIESSFKIIDISSTNFLDFAKNILVGKKILLDLKTFNYKFILQLKKIISYKKGKIEHDNEDLIYSLWKDRPLRELKQIFQLKSNFSGLSVSLKHKALFKQINSKFVILTSPESICWLLNLRGYDLENSPIVLSRLIATKNKLYVFIDLKKVPEKLINDKLIHFLSSSLFEEYIKKIKKNESIFLDSSVSYFHYNLLSQRKQKLTINDDPCKILKARKNKLEIKCSREAHINDGISLANFFCWLENQKYNDELNEFKVAKELENFRKKNDNFFSLSFPTISAVGSNGSIIHYKPEEKKCLNLKKGQLYLCDSGGQYYGATTDVTRTILLGNKKPKKEYIDTYTRVLIGHLNLSMLKFPKGTKGYQIDSLARYSLWENGLDYNHGTGHGVGSFLNVHEGPQSISKRYSNVQLDEGMIISNEPGFYKNGEYGIRIENLVLVKKSDVKNFLEFETLTMFPYEKNLIDIKMLNYNQKQWINNYHKEIYKKISPHLRKKEKFWLRNKTFSF